MYWEYFELQFDALIKKIGSGEAEKPFIANSDKVSCASIFEFRIDTLLQPRKTDNLNDEFLPFSWFDFPNQGIKLKLRILLMHQYKTYSCIHLFFLLKIAALYFKKHVLFLSRDLLTSSEQL